MITIVLSVFIAMITFGAGELCADEFEELGDKADHYDVHRGSKGLEI